MIHTPDEIKPFIFGLPALMETWPKLRRMPDRTVKSLSRSIQHLATNLSGARIRFYCNTDYLSIDANVPKEGGMDHFCLNGQCGIDLYVDGQYWQTYYHARHIHQRFTFPDKRMHLIEMYLPLYGGLELKQIGTAAPLQPAPFYPNPLPIVFYGSSITQGGCASRAGLSYSAILGRKLNMDIVNLGLSGNGRGDMTIANFMAEINASLYVLDWGANLTADNEYDLFVQRYEPFYATLRKAHPKTPIILINLPRMNQELQNAAFHQYADRYRTHIIEVYERLRKAGDQNVWYIPALSFIGYDEDYGTVDGTHPNDHGFLCYAEKLEEFIREEKIWAKTI